MNAVFQPLRYPQVLVSPKVAADIYGCCVRTLSRWAAAGKIAAERAYKFGHRRYWVNGEKAKERAFAISAALTAEAALVASKGLVGELIEELAVVSKALAFYGWESDRSADPNKDEFSPKLRWAIRRGELLTRILDSQCFTYKEYGRTLAVALGVNGTSYMKEGINTVVAEYQDIGNMAQALWSAGASDDLLEAATDGMGWMKDLRTDREVMDAMELVYENLHAQGSGNRPPKVWFQVLSIANGGPWKDPRSDLAYGRAWLKTENGRAWLASQEKLPQHRKGFG